MSLIMKLSKNGYALIEKWEPFRAIPSEGCDGILRVGFGHTRTAFPDDSPITLQQGVSLMESDINILLAYIEHKFKWFSQNKVDALLSLLYDIGIKDFEDSKLPIVLAEFGDDPLVADEWIKFRYGKVSFCIKRLKRRLDELQLYFS